MIDIIDRLNVFQVLLGCFVVTGVFINSFIVKNDCRWAFFRSYNTFRVNYADPTNDWSLFWERQTTKEGVSRVWADYVNLQGNATSHLDFLTSLFCLRKQQRRANLMAGWGWHSQNFCSGIIERKMRLDLPGFQQRLSPPQRFWNEIYRKDTP